MLRRVQARGSPIDTLAPAGSSWRDIDVMTEPAHEAQQRGSARPELSAIAAQLFVADIQASCDFFTRKLGFAVVFVYGEPPFYAQVCRDNARINLRHVD